MLSANCLSPGISDTDLTSYCNVCLRAPMSIRRSRLSTNRVLRRASTRLRLSTKISMGTFWHISDNIFRMYIASSTPSRRACVSAANEDFTTLRIFPALHDRGHMWPLQSAKNTTSPYVLLIPSGKLAWDASVYTFRWKSLTGAKGGNATLALCSLNFRYVLLAWFKSLICADWYLELNSMTSKALSGRAPCTTQFRRPTIARYSVLSVLDNSWSFSPGTDLGNSTLSM